VKMKGDSETAYEADVLVLMERMQEITRDGIKVWRRGTIIGDRSGLLDGKQFDDPTFADFEPYYDFLCSSTGKKEQFKEGSMEGALNVSRDREWMENRQRAERYFEEIEGLFRSYLPGVGPKEKKVQADIFHTVFDTRSASAIGAMRAEDLDAGRRAIEYLWQKLIERGSWLAKMQENKSQSFNLADYIKQQYQEYLKPKEAQENDDIPFFATPEKKDSNGRESRRQGRLITSLERIRLPPAHPRTHAQEPQRAVKGGAERKQGRDPASADPAPGWVLGSMGMNRINSKISRSKDNEEIEKGRSRQETGPPGERVRENHQGNDRGGKATICQERHNEGKAEISEQQRGSIVRAISLRHSFASIHLMNGTPIPEVSAMLGHANVNITLTVYTHFIPRMQTDSASRLAEAIFSGDQVGHLKTARTV
jgi:hypothetical protein